MSITMLMIATCCNNKTHNEYLHKPLRGIYHWKTTFAPTKSEINFILQHGVGRLYIHYFDVVLRDGVVQPEATVRFDRNSDYFTIIDSLEIVPTVYITTEALKAIKDEPDFFITPDSVAQLYASKIITRIRAMNHHNQVKHVHEVQIDCDWTSSLTVTYFQLLSHLRKKLHAQGVALSVTIRLHQLKSAIPPADMGVLMLYNTGRLMDAGTRNSIIDIDDVKPYFNALTHYDLPLDFALPDFGWQVCFSNGKFLKLVPPNGQIPPMCEVRVEQSHYDTIMQVKQLAQKHLRNTHGQSTILYHLDESFLNKFTHDEIENIYGHDTGSCRQ